LFSVDSKHTVEISPESLRATWWSQPFNGQLKRFSNLVEISGKFKPQIAIETGTFYGTSTLALSSHVSDKTFTIEINPEKDRVEIEASSNLNKSPYLFHYGFEEVCQWRGLSSFPLFSKARNSQF